MSESASKLQTINIQTMISSRKSTGSIFKFFWNFRSILSDNIEIWGVIFPLKNLGFQKKRLTVRLILIRKDWRHAVIPHEVFPILNLNPKLVFIRLNILNWIKNNFHDRILIYDFSFFEVELCKICYQNLTRLH